MFAVVAMHCTVVFQLASPGDWIPAYLLCTVFKFGTIGFFLVSGFLLEDALRSRSSGWILSNRLRKVLLPWVTWFGVTLGLLTMADALRRHSPFAPGVSLGAAVSFEVTRCLMSTALWFVPNLLLSVAALLLFRKQLHRLWFGAILLGVNLFYSANIYAEWIPASHTRAFFGFVLYLWLGCLAATRRDALGGLLHRTRWGWLLGCTAGAAALSFWEARLLRQLGSADPLNTLRVSNQIFSILVVFCLCKLPWATWPRFVDVPRHVFGIYLSHAFLLAGALALVHRLCDRGVFGGMASSAGVRVVLWLVVTAAVWGTGLMLTRWIAGRASLCWMLGQQGRGNGKAAGFAGVSLGGAKLPRSQAASSAAGASISA